MNDGVCSAALLHADVLQLIAARLPLRNLKQARLTCKSWAHVFTAPKRTIYAQQPIEDTCNTLALLPSLGAIVLHDLGHEQAFSPHLGVIAAHGSQVTRLILEHHDGSRTADAEELDAGFVGFPTHLRSLDLSRSGPWNDAFNRALGSLPHLTHLSISRVTCSQASWVLPWDALSRLQSLELHLWPEPPSPFDTAHAAHLPGGLSSPSTIPAIPDSAAAKMLSSASHGNASVLSSTSIAALVHALASRLPLLSYLQLHDVPNPADDPGVMALLSAASLAASGAAGSGAQALPSHISMSFLNAEDDCDYLSSAEVLLPYKQGGFWVHAGGASGSSRGCKGAAASGGEPSYTRCAAVVELGVHVMVITDTSGSGSGSSSRASSMSRSNSSSSAEGSSFGGCQDSHGGGGFGERSSSSRGGMGRCGGGGDKECSGAHAYDRGDSRSCVGGGGAATSLTQDVLDAVEEQLSKCGMRLLPAHGLAGGGAAGASRDVAGTAGLTPAHPAAATAVRPGEGANADKCAFVGLPLAEARGPGQMQAADAAAAALAHLEVASRNSTITNSSTSSSSSSSQSDGGCRRFPGPSAGGGSTAAGSNCDTTPCHNPPDPFPNLPRPCQREGLPFASICSLDLVLCCDASAGNGSCCGHQPLALDFSPLPALRSLALRLFSTSIATSFSRGCELRLRGLAALTSLQLLRSDGGAPPPDLAGGLAAALAQEAPRLQRLVAEGAVMMMSTTEAKANTTPEATRDQPQLGRTGVACDVKASTSSEPCGDGSAAFYGAPAAASVDAPSSGGSCCGAAAGLAALAGCKRLEHFVLRLLPNCRPPRYSRSVCAAWLPPSLTRLELSHADLHVPHAAAAAAAAATGTLEAEKVLAEAQGESVDAAAGTTAAVASSAGEEMATMTKGRREGSGSFGVAPTRPVSPLLPRLANLQLQFCRVDNLLALTAGEDLAQLTLSNCAAPGATAAAIAATWPSLQHLSVNASLAVTPSLRTPRGLQQQQQHSGHQQQQQPSQPRVSGCTQQHEQERQDRQQRRLTGRERDPAVLEPEDMEALGALEGLRSLFWHAPHAAGGLSPATLLRATCLRGLRRLSLHLGYDNLITPEQVRQAFGKLGNLVELDLVVGHGPCRGAVGGMVGEGRRVAVAVARAGGAAIDADRGGGEEEGGGESLGSLLAAVLPNALVHVRRD